MEDLISVIVIGSREVFLILFADASHLKPQTAHAFADCVPVHNPLGWFRLLPSLYFGPAFPLSRGDSSPPSQRYGASLRAPRAIARETLERADCGIQPAALCLQLFHNFRYVQGSTLRVSLDRDYSSANRDLRQSSDLYHLTIDVSLSQFFRVMFQGSKSFLAVQCGQSVPPLQQLGGALEAHGRKVIRIVRGLHSTSLAPGGLKR
jgi:hypothetical protein